MNVPIKVLEALPFVGQYRYEVKRGTVCPVPIHNTNRSSARRSLKRRAESFDDVSRLTERRRELLWRFSWQTIPDCRIPRRVVSSVSMKPPLGIGASGGSKRDFLSGTSPVAGDPGSFPPRLITTIKSIACEVPAKRQQPVSRLFVPDIRRILIAEKHVKSIGLTTIWRILDADALKPWRQRSWIWSRDPLFFERAARVLDLYEGKWKGRRLSDDEFVISADEKTSIQARIRLHETEIVADGRGQHVEHEYKRGGAWSYLAAYDVHRARIFGRLEQSNGIEPFHRLVAHVMRREPYASARRVFWIVDQGSSHRPTTFPERLRNQFRNAVGVSLPVHASWLNQIEIYLSILQRKGLTPNDFPNLDAVKIRIQEFARLYNRRAKPFNWNFTRTELRELADRLDAKGHYRETG